MRDAENFNLSQEEDNIMKNKKIGVVGFRVFYYVRCCFNRKDNNYSMSQNLIRALQLIYQKNDSEILPINPNRFIDSNSDHIAASQREIFLSTESTAKQFFPYGNKMETSEAKPDKTIPEENLRFFLKTYLDYTQHLGFPDIMEILDFSDKNKIYFKKNDFDYWVIGLHDIKHDSGFNLSHILFFYTLGILPILEKKTEESIIFIFDKKLNLIKKMELTNDYKVLAASWVIWQDPTGHNFYTEADFYSVNERINVNKPILKQFSKEFIHIIKEKK